MWTSLDASHNVRLHMGPPPTEPILPLDDYRQKVLRAARRGNVYPYELTDLLAGPDGTFTEHDLDEAGALVPVSRPKGKNSAAIVAGVVSTPDAAAPRGRHPGGAARRPDQVARRAVASPSAPASSPRSTSPSGSACRSSGSRCRPARGSR